MNEVKMSKHNPDFASDEPGVGIIDLLIILARYKKLIGVFTCLVVLGAVAISLLLPVTYQATTKLLPPQPAQSTASSLISQFSGAAGLVVGAGGLKNPNDLYVGMLQSRTVADRLISKMNLTALYQTDELAKTRKKLADRTNITSGKDGLITIEVEDEDSKRSAQLANEYVKELIHLTRTLALTEASQRRMFYEQELEKAKDNVVNSEVALKDTLDSSGVINVDAESRSIVETSARLKARISAKEVELSSMKAFVTTSHPEFLKANEELSSLKSELGKLENGRQRSADFALQAVGKPSSGFNNIKLLRDLKYYQMLYELLAKQYEIARLDEAKDPAVIQVLDAAVEPEKRFKPKRTIFVLISLVVGLVGGVIIAIVSEGRKQAMREPKFAAQWQELRAAVRFSQK